jgi:sugar O-acyltransferase (sialic acid O-acetyltransferase NeuD family)
MSKILAIIGAGDLGQQIAHYAITDHHYNEVVFFDDFTKNAEINGHKVIGPISEVEVSFATNVFNELIIGIGYKHLNFRKSLYHQFVKSIPFGTIVHSTCWIDTTARILPGCVLYPNCSIDAYATVQPNAILNLNCSIAHHSTIGAHSFLSPRVAIAGFVTIEEQVIIGINATLIDSITIVSNTQIGGGTVVIDDLKISGLYVGNPAKFIR